MTSQKEKNLSTLYNQNKEAVVELAFQFLLSEDNENKKQVRTDITSSEWFDGEGILSLAGKLMHDSRAGWGRSKRNAILAWYLKRPLRLVKKQMGEHPYVGNISHKNVVSFLHVPSHCIDEERYHFFIEMVDEDQRFDQPKFGGKSSNTQGGFWSFIRELLGL
jgi:hypothetical protein